MAPIEVDVLVIGAGPAGASLSSFLGQNGMKGLVVDRASSTAKTPRAHVTNSLSMRLEFEAIRISRSGEEIGGQYIEGDTAVGKEYLRAQGWYSSQDTSKGEWTDYSPCSFVDLPQSELEPLFVKYATQNGFTIRYNTEFVSFEDHVAEGYVVSTLRDVLLDQTYTVRSRFLCGADGARSKVAQQLNLPFTNGLGGGFAYNVLYEADLSQYMTSDNRYLLKTCIAANSPSNPIATVGLNRVIKPWFQFLMILMVAPQPGEPDFSEDAIVARTKEFLGCDPPDFKLLSITRWKINERYAQNLSGGNVFCLGDAIHQHPPTYGLGSNTCIQDAFNLAWKLALVAKGTASPKLLESYTQERQPVAKQIVELANSEIREHMKLWAHLGSFEETPEKRKEVLAQMNDESAKGKAYRKTLRELHRCITHETHGLGVHVNIDYENSGAIYLKDEASPRTTFTSDAHYAVQRSTYPGFMLPHAWISRQRKGRQMSTIDLCGKARFTLLTGVGGKSVWKAAVDAQSLKSPSIEVFSIGPGQDYEDVLWMWQDIRDIEDDGAILVRPDLYIAWRCESADGKTAAECSSMLGLALTTVLGKS